MFFRKSGLSFKDKRVRYILVVGISILFLASTLFAAGTEEEKEGMYEKYVAGVPEGCEPVPRECFEQAVAGETFAM